MSTDRDERGPAGRQVLRALAAGSVLMGMTTNATGCATTPVRPPPAPQLRPAGVTPPRAAKKPKELTIHGHTRIDEYYWLRDDTRKDPEVLAYLEAENAYKDAVLGGLKAHQDALFAELKGRIKQDDSSVPTLNHGYWYYTRFVEGGEYPIHCRRPETMEAPEQVMLDVNALAEGKEYFSAVGLTVSHDDHLLAWGEDEVSRRIYTIVLMDLRTGERLPDRLEGTTGHAAWARDGKTIFYIKKDPETLRSRWVYRHTLGTDQSDDVVVHDETDEAFYVGVSRSKSRDWVMIDLESTLVSETLVRSADDPVGPFRPVLPREPDHEYSVWAHAGRFYIRTNWKALNFRLMSVAVEDSADKSKWEEIIGHRDDVYLGDIELFDDHLVVSERKDALRQIRVIRWADGAEHYLTFDEDVFVAVIGQNPAFATTKLRFAYGSPVTPNSIFEYDMETRERRLLKQDEVLGGYDPANYTTERTWATADDGVKIPISLVYRRGLKKDGQNPLYQYGYGSYGYSMDPWLTGSWISLLDRGFVVAVAHIRGGQELGRRWYDDGKMFAKKNTFTDFIACTEHLIAEGWTKSDRTVASGGSAGGLLMGAIVNMRPDLYRAVHASVPFVDVVTTMLDESIPLTTNEFDEWGNPTASKASYEYILSYSPYDRVTAQDYPHLMITTGLHDSQVQYWEPAKWVARLRDRKTDENLLLLETEMETGHGGASGRFARLERTARVYSFYLYVLGMIAPAQE